MEALILMLGLIFGSFFNVILFRLDRKNGIWLGRSECPKCKKQLEWFDLIPVLSFIFLRARCRYCKQKISAIYPMVEITTALVFLIFYIQNPVLNMSFGLNIIILIGFILILFFDYIYFIIPDKIVFPLIALTLIYSFYFERVEFIYLLTSGLLLGGFFAILYLVSKGKWVGFGDAKLALLIGLFFGYPFGFIIVVLSIWSATLVGLILIANKKASLKSELPFGSFLSLFSIIFILFQSEIQIFKAFF